mgnify:CR=1 FL=1
MYCILYIAVGGAEEKKARLRAASSVTSPLRRVFVPIRPREKRLEKPIKRKVGMVFAYFPSELSYDGNFSLVASRVDE